MLFEVGQELMDNIEGKDRELPCTIFLANMPMISGIEYLWLLSNKLKYTFPIIFKPISLFDFANDSCANLLVLIALKLFGFATI